jgi:type IV secretory pathway TrbD component
MNEIPVSVAQPAPDVPRLAAIARESSTWMKFLGVMSILQGALAAITIVGLVIAWLPIWLGILLFRASEDAVTAAQGDTLRFESYLRRLNRYFVIQGIVTLLGIVVGVIVFFAAGMAAMSALFH